MYASANLRAPAREQGVLLLITLLFVACGPGDLEDEERGAFVTEIIAWGEEVPEDQITIQRHDGYGDVRDMALIRLEVVNIPEEYEGRRFTVVGGGAHETGLHGLNSTGFQGNGYRFAAAQYSESENRVRTPDYEADFSRVVTNGRLVYDVYYEPASLEELGYAYSEEMEIALQIVRAGTNDPVVYGSERLDGRVAVGGVRRGDTAHLTIRVRDAATAE